MLRTGLLFKKLGMSQIYQDGTRRPVTVLQLETTRVCGQRSATPDGYHAVVLSTGACKAHRLGKPVRGQYSKVSLEPQAKRTEFRVSPQNLLEIGVSLSVAHFQEGQFIDATARSIGKGFAGVMKRHHFGGLHASHGVSVSHRSSGSTGHCQEPGRVFKNKKMAGHMGDKRVTSQNLHVVRVDTQNEVLYVRGSVPGPKGGWVRVRDAVKKPPQLAAAAPAAAVAASAPAVAPAGV